MIYRREIDGLRAIAVLPVIFFHADFKFFSGGFVGVDVFFVLSGYLITSIILHERSQGDFTIAGFYERRARRILPALFFVMLVCSLFSWIWLLPVDFENFSLSLIATSIFSSNLYFWKSLSYFAGEAELKPLLHTWSLAVEEQYYVFFPPLLLLILNLGKNWVVAIFFTIALISFGFAEYASTNHVAANFYLLPTRGWELLIGVLAALYLFYYKETDTSDGLKIKEEILSLLGLLMIVFSFVAYSKDTPFPSFYALVPTVGTCLMVIFCLPQTIVGRILTLKPVVGIGLISYSLYLWHWPIFAFARYKIPEELNGILPFALICLSLFIAYISWKYLEAPFRNRKNFNRKKIFSFSLISIMICSLIGFAVYSNKGFEDYYMENRLSSEQKKLLVLAKTYTKKHETLSRLRECLLDGTQTSKDFSDSCKNISKGPTSFLIWGDSNAGALASGLIFHHKNFAQYTSSACAPLIGVSLKDRPRCREVNDFVLKQIEVKKPAAVWLHSNWLRYDSKSLNLTEELKKTIITIKKASPTSKVFIVGGVPQWRPSLPLIMISKSIFLNEETFIATPRTQEIRTVDRKIKKVALDQGATFLSSLDHFCERSVCKPVVKKNDRVEFITYDNSHLTELGSRYLAGKLLLEAK